MTSRKYLTVGLLVAAIAVSSSDRTTKCVNERLTLACPMDHAINVVNATYGHPQDSIQAGDCSYNQDDCSSEAEDVWAQCHGQSECYLIVPQIRNTSCDAPSQYLSVEYTCKSVSCSTSPQPAHGSIAYSQPYLTLGQTATYSCDDGYQLTGPRVRVCQADSTWTGFEPSCSILPSECPTANFSVVTYGSSCHEIVGTSATWTDAANMCSLQGWRILNMSDGPRVEYLLQELLKRGWRRSIWAGQDPKGTCFEWLYNGSWVQSATQCDYLNRFICTFDVGMLKLMRMPPENNMKELYIIMGAVAGILVLLFLIFGVGLLIRRSAKKTSPRTSESRDPLPEEDMYYDEAASATSVSEQGENTPPGTILPRYSKVDKSNKNDNNLNDATDYDYDPVCIPSTPPKKTRPNYENTNLPTREMIGSLKKRLQQPRADSVYVNGLDQPDVVYMNGTTDTPVPDNKDDIIPVNGERPKKKPKPAPKPNLPNYLGKPLNNQEQKLDTLKRPIAVAPRLNITSELELVENELYIAKPRPK